MLVWTRAVGGFAACFCLTLLGCSGGPGREPPPAISPSGAGQAAIAEYDTNHDGVISGEELKKCPALRRALSRYDTNGDGKVTADKIAARIEKWQESKVAAMHVGILLSLDGQPLEGASVTAEPEAFLGTSISPATGTTTASGSTDLNVPGKRGAQCGLYKLRVSKQVNGKETIPPRYNTATEFGIEVARDVPELAGGAFEFKMSSK